MDRDDEALKAKLAEYEGLMKFAILPADPAAFKAGWQAALAYAREEREGWKLVPVEPTPDMCIKGAIAWAEALPDSGSHVDTADACYKAMLAAYPPPQNKERTTW